MKKKFICLIAWKRNFCFVLLFLFIITSQFSVHAAENIKVGTSTRNMIVYVPENLPANRPLVISMHGMNQDAAYQQAQAKWELVADTAKFAVVYPNGINKAWDISGTSDVDFLLTVIDTMYSRYAIDRNRVYLSGFSMGGMMTYHAANKIADKIAAFAPVSGYPLYGSNYNTSRPIPIIHVHGDADDVVKYDNVENYVSGWAKRNSCPETPVITRPYPANKPTSSATKRYWGPGTNGTEVVLLTLGGKGHWYSMDPASVYTSLEIWNFCKRYALSYEEEESREDYISSIYNFENDEAISIAGTPPAIDMTIAQGNNAMAGVISYTDAAGVKSNMLKPYRLGQKKNTGVIDLNRFSRKATNYSVAWKQCVSGSKADCKFGVLLRGDTLQVGDDETGYVQGIMAGYLFMVYNNRSQSSTEFRIYESTMENGIVMKVSESVSGLNPGSAQPMWYRASVSGSKVATLKLEYSIDNKTWHTGAVYYDFDVTFALGATQLVWGLATTNLNFYIDDISFYGNANDERLVNIAIVQSTDTSTVVSEEYYTLTGQKILNPYLTASRGIYLIRRYLSDGTVTTRKVCFK